MDTFYFLFSGVQDIREEFPVGFVLKEKDLRLKLGYYTERLMDVQIGSIVASDYEEAYETLHFGV